ncbi:MAG: SEC-C metal-binding domain-containing protein [bacterium]
MKEISRNAPCPCGSGKKYKNCCEGKKLTVDKRKRTAKNRLLLIAVLIPLLGAGAFGLSEYLKPGQYDDFARCLAEKNVKMYGASWCSHCLEQKQMFGKSSRLMPYVECGSFGGNETTAECKKAGVKKFPTWTFPDGSRYEGKMTMGELAARSGCELMSP